jgi:UPF0271 protein
MPPRFDFNCDMGESFGAWTMGLDAEVIRFVTSANIACGFHAGDPATMRRTVRLAEEHGVGIGAHPGFPDLNGFGRRNLAASPAEVRDDLVYQIGALTAFARARRLQHVKPHGALYNMAVPGGDLARAICDAVLETDPAMLLVVLAGSPWVDVARAAGVRVAREVFADRAFTASGTLVPRSQPGAVIHDRQQVIERLERAQIANARMNDMHEVWAHEQLKARHRWIEVDTPVGKIPALLPPGIPDGLQPRIGAIPALGAHTDAILHELGYDDPTIAKLRQERAI